MKERGLKKTIVWVTQAWQFSLEEMIYTILVTANKISFFNFYVYTFFRHLKDLIAYCYICILLSRFQYFRQKVIMYNQWMSPFVIIIKCVLSQNKIKLSFLLFSSDVMKLNDTNGSNYLQPPINFSCGNGLSKIDSSTQ